MVHCPECQTTLTDEADVEFETFDKESEGLASAKRWYVISCAECEYMIGGAAAGARMLG